MPVFTQYDGNQLLPPDNTANIRPFWDAYNPHVNGSFQALKARSSALVQPFVLPLLRGCGQMLFQPSARTGGIFLLLIASQSLASFAMCLVGVVGATLSAYRLEHPDKAYVEGLGGFNGGLLGLALSVFYDFSGVLLVIGFAGGMITGLVRVALVRSLPIPPFTTPFVLVTWLVFICGDSMALVTVDPPAVDAWPIYAVATNASQVLFLLHPWGGILVFIAVLVHSRTAALWVGGASLIAWVTVLLFNLPADPAAAGLLGYNALILAAALQHRKTPVLLAVAGVVVSVWLTHLFFLAGVTPLSAPFVLSAWLVIAAETLLARHPSARG